MLTFDNIPSFNNLFIEDNIGDNNTCPRLFNADMVQCDPVPITESGGSTKPNDHRAYLFVHICLCMVKGVLEMLQ